MEYINQLMDENIKEILFKINARALGKSFIITEMYFKVFGKITENKMGN